MASPDEGSHTLHASLVGRSFQHAMSVLADATYATVVLFDEKGAPIAGPVAGNFFIERLLDTERGRRAVIARHRAAINTIITPTGDSADDILPPQYFDHIVIPVMLGQKRIAHMTIGDRPSREIPREIIDRMEFAAGLPSGSLRSRLDSILPWDLEEASSARNMAALVAELFTEICEQEVDLQQRIDELGTVYNIAALLAGTRDLQETLDKTARMVCEVMRVKACSIRLLDEQTGELNIKAVHNLSDEYLSKGPVIADRNPIDSAALRGLTVYVPDAPTDGRTQYPDQARKEGIVSGLVCGMVFQGKPLGVLRVYTGEPHRFTTFEEALLRAVASQAATAIANARLLDEALESQRTAQQLAYAGEVQRRMIPSEPPSLPHLDIGAVYRPTENVGGDFYDFITLPKGNFGVVIADVVGHGVPASLLMASVRATLRVYAYFTYDIDKIFSEVNEHVCRETTMGEFVTAFYGVFTPDGRRLTCCNAGHDPPMLLRGGEIQYLRAGGMVLGVDPDEKFDRELIHLKEGDILLLNTDGVVEAMNFNDEEFSRERLAESLKRHAHEPAKRIVRNILWDLRRFRGFADRLDDVTLVVIKIL